MRNEAAASAEALEAERAAKFAADAEARELQRVLDSVSESLSKERCGRPALRRLALRRSELRESVRAVVRMKGAVQCMWGVKPS
jgi:hypothetical protein